MNLDNRNRKAADRLPKMEAELKAAHDLIRELGAALAACNRTFEGSYPWMLQPGIKWTQKEARETCHKHIQKPLTNFYVWRNGSPQS